MVKIVLDLFSGSGSASQPFIDRGGYKVYRYDIDPKGADGIFVDLKDEFFLTHLIDTWKGKRIKLLWASPPCTEYSDVTNWKGRASEWRPNTLLWHNVLRIVQALEPENFVIENVRGAQKTWGPCVQKHGPYYLWGNFPKFSVPDKIPPKHLHQYKNHKERAAESAKIPYTISYHLEKAIRLQKRL